jgi:CheY-like chemotaxis protein
MRPSRPCRRVQKYDAITLDLMMGDIEGADVLNAARAGGLNVDTPVIVVSVIADSIAASAHVHDWLQKPVPSDRLIASLHRAGLASPQARPVLVVDDDPTAVKLAEELIRGSGYSVVSRTSAAVALREIADIAPSAVILDLTMPEMDGFTFLQELRRTPGGAGIPVIVWTSRDLSADDRSYLETVGQKVMSKSSDGISELVGELNAWVGAAGITRNPADRRLQ